MEQDIVLKELGFDIKETTVSAFRNEEDPEEEYAVWKVVNGEKEYVIKEAKEYEAEVYEKVLCGFGTGVPEIYKIIKSGGKDYILMECFSGRSLRICDRKRLKAALDALINLQDAFWEKEEYSEFGLTFEKSLLGREKRGTFLDDEELEKTYKKYLSSYNSLPRTLCHDDFLPFNVLATDEKAVIIDWEFAGMLPYLSSVARLIAHGEEDENAFFCMSNDDKAFAVEYFYDNLVYKKGINYEDYIKDLDLFLFYEYCEWVMIGVKYNSKDSERYIKYYSLAKDMAKKINNIK